MNEMEVVLVGRVGQGNVPVLSRERRGCREKGLEGRKAGIGGGMFGRGISKGKGMNGKGIRLK
jgi:hypothetical protein